MSIRLARGSVGLRLLPALAALGVLAAGTDPARAQGPFRVTWTVEKTGPTHVELAGQVTNDSLQDVVEVYVTAAALNASGKVLARGITFVASQIPPRRSAEFSARVPNVPGTASFRVTVSNFRYGITRGESP